jgi:hypothetical protein
MIRPRLRVPLAIVGGVLAGLAVIVLVNSFGTDYERVGLTWVTGRQAKEVPDWTRPCWRRHQGRPDGAIYTLPCVSVRGRVLYREDVDPDGDGDAHLVVLANARVAVIKVPESDRPQDLPGIGDRVRAVGLADDGPLFLPAVRLPDGDPR